MPKSSIPNPVKGRSPIRSSHKFKLGGRSSTVGALSLSNAALVAALRGANGKSSQKIKSVLSQRGFDLATYVAAEAAKAAKTTSDVSEEANTPQ